MISYLKTLMLLRVLILVIYLKKMTIAQKLIKLQRKFNHKHDNYITTQIFDKLTSENFEARLKQENLGSKNDIVDLVKKDRFR